jgi:general secretion pathway protein L
MATVLNNKLTYWSSRIRGGKAAAFFRWWWGELRQVLPSRWQELLQHAARRIVLLVEPDALQLGIEESHSIRWLDTFPLQQEAALQRQQIRVLIEQQEMLEAPRFLLLDRAKILNKCLALPAATAANLQQVLAFEMDRQTPFRAADVYYTWKTSGVVGESGQIALDLFVVPRKAVDPTLELLESRGIAASGIDVVEDGRSSGVNLLPAEKRFRVVNPKSRLNYTLASAAVVLLAVLMAQSLHFRANRVAELEAAIADVQDEAKSVQRLRQQVEETSEAASFLTRRRAQLPLAIELLADVTDTLPDDTYLDRLVIGQEGVTLQGKSRNAQQLIEVVNKSEVFENAAFRGSTRLDAASGLEIFEINAQISGAGTP